MSTRTLRGVALALVVAASVSFVGIAEAGTAIDLATGATTVKGHVKGKDFVEYTLQAKQGQTLHAKLTSSGENEYFDVTPPGGGERLFIGTRVGDEFTGALPADGEYTIKVYIAGYYAAQGEEADYSLAVDLK